MFQPGPRNLITDVPGILVGHAVDERAASGVTVVACATGRPAAVDVRGGGPGTRETDALAPENLIGRAHAVVLAGGSVFGLAAADGVTAALSQRGAGLTLRPGSPAIPIVPAAVLHDLGNGGDKSWGLEPPYRALGIEALQSATAACALGSVGAGRGAMAGVERGGIGSASLDLGGGIVVGALVAVNSIGSARMPGVRNYWAWAFELQGEFGGGGPPPRFTECADPAPDDSRLQALGRLAAGSNTTLAVVATNGALGGAECKRMAMMAHDGIARALRPAHTSFDGDTVFALGGEQPLAPATSRAGHVSRIGSAAADCLARAIARAVHHAAAAPL